MAAADLQHVERLLPNADNGDRGVVIADSGFSGRITAQHNPLESLGLRRGIVTPEPCRLYHIAVGRRRVLLVLSGADPTADLPFQLLELPRIFTLPLQQLPNLPPRHPRLT